MGHAGRGPTCAGFRCREKPWCSLPFLLLVSPEEEPAHLFQLHVHGGGGRQPQAAIGGDEQVAVRRCRQPEKPTWSRAAGLPAAGERGYQRVMSALTQASASTSPPTSLGNCRPWSSRPVWTGAPAGPARAPSAHPTPSRACGCRTTPAAASISDCPPLQELLLGCRHPGPAPAVSWWCSALPRSPAAGSRPTGWWR